MPDNEPIPIKDILPEIVNTADLTVNKNDLKTIVEAKLSQLPETATSTDALTEVWNITKTLKHRSTDAGLAYAANILLKWIQTKEGIAPKTDEEIKPRPRVAIVISPEDFNEKLFCDDK